MIVPSLTQLRYILAVHRHGHFGKAAEACHVSQPTLSAQVQRAEEELGFEVFDRRCKPIGLTDKGRALIEPTHEVVSAHERLLQMARGQFDCLAGDLALGVIPTVAPYVLPWFLKPFAEAHPRVRLHIFERTTEGMVEDMQSRRLDAGILATPLDVSSLTERVLFNDPFYLYAEASEPILERGEVDPSALEPCKLWLLQDGHCVRNQTLAVCGLADGTAHLGSVRFEAGSLETLRHLVDASGGYTILPETFVRSLPREPRRKQVRPLGDPTPTREISLVHPKASWKADLFDALEAVIRAHIPRSLRHVEPGQVLPVQPQPSAPAAAPRRKKSKTRDD